MYEPDLDRPKTFSLIYCPECYEAIEEQSERVNKQTRRKREVLPDLARYERLRYRP